MGLVLLGCPRCRGRITLRMRCCPRCGHPLLGLGRQAWEAVLLLVTTMAMAALGGILSTDFRTSSRDGFIAFLAGEPYLMRAVGAAVGFLCASLLLARSRGARGRPGCLALLAVGVLGVLLGGVCEVLLSAVLSARLLTWGALALVVACLAPVALGACTRKPAAPPPDGAEGQTGGHDPQVAPRAEGNPPSPGA